jgi:CRP/FNR family cyclic AMP-dependent transcriptional regulator
MIITEGQPGEVVYIVLSGTLKVFSGRPDGTEVIISIVGAGDLVGEMSLVDSIGRSASVVTLEPSILLWMHRTAFQDCLINMNRFAVNLVRIMAGRLRLNTEHIQTLAALDVNGRVARQILAFADKYGQQISENNVRISIRLTQGDMADLVGASRKRVNQVMVALKRQGLVSIDEEYRITVHNRAELAKICC